MMITTEANGKVVSISFEPSDRLEDIAAVCRCTSQELADLMHTLWIEEWAGQYVDWEDQE